MRRGNNVFMNTYELYDERILSVLQSGSYVSVHTQQQCTLYHNKKMNGVLGHDPAHVRLYCPGDNLGRHLI